MRELQTKYAPMKDLVEQAIWCANENRASLWESLIDATLVVMNKRVGISFELDRILGTGDGFIAHVSHQTQTAAFQLRGILYCSVGPENQSRATFCLTAFPFILGQRMAPQHEPTAMIETHYSAHFDHWTEFGWTIDEHDEYRAYDTLEAWTRHEPE